MEPEGSLPFPQNPATGPYLEPDKSVHSLSAHESRNPLQYYSPTYA
jgi:hypothetical protein